MRICRRRKNERKGFTQPDYARLLDAAHQQLGGPIVLIWDNVSTHLDVRMRALIDTRPWLTVCYLPTYAPELNPMEMVWSQLKRGLGNLAPCTLDELAAIIRSRLKQLQYRPEFLDAFLTHTDLITSEIEMAPRIFILCTSPSRMLLRVRGQEAGRVCGMFLTFPGTSPWGWDSRPPATTLAVWRARAR